MKIYYLKGNITKNIKPKIYYFDNNSTTLIYDDDIKKGIMNWISCGNPSNTLHDLGKNAHDKIEQCRHMISQELNIHPCELYFTSCATESNNIALQGIINHYIRKDYNKKYSVITSSFEHPSVRNIFKYYEKHCNIDVIYIDPCKDKNDRDFGCIKAANIEEAIKQAKSKVILISIMHANNETGAIQDIKEIGSIAKKYEIFFHSDVTQSMGKYIICPREYNLSSISFSGHKFHGPKGVGGLYISKKCSNIINLCFGGEQEAHLRPGTENVASIVGISMALLKVHENRKQKNIKLSRMKKYIIEKLGKNEKIKILGASEEKTLPNTILVMLENIKTCNKKLVKYLNEKNIYISVGSACQTNSGKTSHVLNTMNLNDDDKTKIIRISLSDYNTMKECVYLVENLLAGIREN